MATSFSRTGSTSNRRSANLNGARSRASTNRAGEYEEPILQHEDVSSRDYESATNEGNPERGSKPFSRELDTTERRIEKKSVVTREKIIRRSPIKESSSAGNRGDLDRQRKHVESPTFRRKQKESEEREQARFSERRNANGYSNKSMESAGYPETSLFRSARV